MLSVDNPYYRQVRLLIEVLPIVAQERQFALKGGTAINLFVRDLPRLSVDIDLTYLPIQEREESLAGIDDALRRIGAQIERSLRGVRTFFPARKGGRVAKFQVRGPRAQIQIEVSPVLRGSVCEPQLMDSTPAVTEQFGVVQIPILHPMELYAGKLCAALDRQHPRDLFDVMQLQRAEGLNRTLFDLFLVYLLSGDRPISEMLAPRLLPLSETFESSFSGMTLAPVSPHELSIARDRLIAELHAMFTEADKAFLLSVKRGNADWTLFSHPGAQELPAVRWKLANLARMTGKKKADATSKLEAVLERCGT